MKFNPGRPAVLDYGCKVRVTKIAPAPARDLFNTQDLINARERDLIVVLGAPVMVGSSVIGGVGDKLWRTSTVESVHSVALGHIVRTRNSVYQMVPLDF